MADIINYNKETLRNFALRVDTSYRKNLDNMLIFDKWKQKAFTKLFNDRNLIDTYPKDIRIAPSTKDMLKVIEEHSDELEEIDNIQIPSEKAIKRTKFLRNLINPERVIHLDEPIRDERDGTPIWFGTTLKEIEVYMGYLNGDSSSPFAINLGDPKVGVSTVHMKIAGGTGSGKTVSMHTLITNLSLLLPPWELQMYLVDLKKIEFIKHCIPVRTPNLKALGATSNTIYFVSILEDFVREMEDRQRLFSILGVENIESFRNKYNVVMPRMIFIVDELPQFKLNLKTAEQLGSTTTNVEKDKYNTAVFKLATLGRSQGNHMIISGQSTSGLVEDGSAKQFSGGLALKVDASEDSVDVIGNGESALLKGKGKGIINLNRGAKDTSYNRLVQIPYINPDLSEEELEQGKQTYLTETILMLDKLNSKYYYSPDFNMFDEASKESLNKFYDNLDTMYERYINSPYTGTDTESLINKDVYKNTTNLSLYLGRKIEFGEDDKFYLDLKRQQNDNIIVSGDKTREYVLSLLAENISYYMSKGLPVENYIINCDLSTYKLSNIDEILEKNKGKNKLMTITESKIPFSIYNKIKTRSGILNLSNKLKMYNESNGLDLEELSNRPLGIWNTDIALDSFIDSNKDVLRKQYSTTLNTLNSLRSVLKVCVENPKHLEEQNEYIDGLINESVSGVSGDELLGLYSIFRNVVMMFTTLKNITGLNRYVSEDDFSRIFIWIIGAENLDEVINADSETIREFDKLNMVGPKLNVVSIMTSKNWRKAYRMTNQFNIVIEKENKSFFNDLSITPQINIYDDTFQVHDKEQKKCSLIREFKLQ